MFEYRVLGERSVQEKMNVGGWEERKEVVYMTLIVTGNEQNMELLGKYISEKLIDEMVLHNLYASKEWLNNTLTIKAVGIDLEGLNTKVEESYSEIKAAHEAKQNEEDEVGDNEGEFEFLGGDTISLDSSLYGEEEED